jgi:hypothetical protein
MLGALRKRIVIDYVKYLSIQDFAKVCLLRGTKL